MATVAGQKRKIAYQPSDASNQARKRQKSRDSRTIPTQHTEPALSKTGELNIGQFIKAREFEIVALEQSMRKARKSLSQRAFQQVPRHMRRRTASHNVKKIPRRLRPQAVKEILEDNTPTGRARRRKPSAKLRLRMQTAKKLQKLNTNRKTVRQKKRDAKKNAKEPDPQNHVDIERIPRIKKNRLAKPPQAIVKYKRRQLDKTWLPTHLWHTKRAHMTRPTMPLWKFAIPLKPTEKTFRPTHRASSARGCVAWDTSYISTIGCQGTEAALDGLLKSLRFAGASESGTKHRKWKDGTRHCEGWAYERDGNNRCIAPISVLWQVKLITSTQTELDEVEMADLDASGLSKEKPGRSGVKKPQLDRRLLIRVHPSAFSQLWFEVLKAAKMQKPQVLVEDLRFEIGSIDIQGPGATEALVGVLKIAEGSASTRQIWSSLAALSNPSSLPLNAMLAFDTIDPRLNHPPSQLSIARGESNAGKMNEMIVTWPIDSDFASSNLFDHRKRYRISTSMPTQKAIDRRRSTLLPGQQLEASEKDPKIPTMLLAHRSPRGDVAYQGSWTVLLPWSCVDPVWRSLMYYPLTTGSTPRFGGLEQKQQVASEQAVPWFPGDYPGTEAGKAWDRTVSEVRFDEWSRHPPSKRIAWDTLDLGPGRKGELGRGWACDWEYLLCDTQPKYVSEAFEGQGQGEKAPNSSEPQLLTQRQRKAAAKKAEHEKEQQQRRRNTSSPECEDDNDYDALQNDVKYGQLTPSDATAVFGNWKMTKLPIRSALCTIRLTYLTRGTPKPAARIYRIPLAKVIDKTATSEPAISAVAKKPGPALFSLSTFQPSIHSTDLRSRWLDLDPNPTSQMFNPNSSTALVKQQGGQRYNHASQPTAARVYDPKTTRDLTHVRAFPPRETRPEVMNMLGPKPPPPTREEMEKLYVPQLVPKLTINKDGELIDEVLWDKHVPCPGPEDLLGFVTSGGYNLAEGAGTAVASLWVQRVVEGWRAEDEASQGKSSNANTQTNDIGEPSTSTAQRKKTRKELEEEKQQAAEERKLSKQIDRQRHLCIVRNAGESVGRLALWELC